MEKQQQLDDRHVVMVTAPCPGHIIPFTQLARYLQSRGVRVSCFSTGMNYPSVEQNIEDSFRGETILFHPLITAAEFVSDEDDHVKYLHALDDGAMAARFEMAMEALDVPPPQCIISDLFTAWTQDVADKRGIARHLLCTFPTNVLFLIFACNPWLPSPDEAPVHPPGTWGVDMTPADSFWNLLERNVKRMPNASLIIVNTFEALEARFLGIVRKGLLGKPGVRTESILTIGPITRSAVRTHAIVPTEISTAARNSGVEEWMPWLDAQEQSSVLYVSFGSVFTLSEVQIHELAHGLENSGRPFLWVYRPPKTPQVQALEANEDDGLPAEFVERVSGRGKLIFGWAPQEAILAHASVGGFLTHCGWNSTLEALWAGKPMALWPIVADQKLTARYFADDLRIAVMVPRGEHGVETRSEVMRAISVLMDDKEMRSRFQSMHELSRSALEEGGASRSNLQILVDSIGRPPLQPGRRHFNSVATDSSDAVVR